MKSVPNRGKVRDRLHEIIFEADTRAGKIFDEVLLVIILASVVAAAIETVPTISEGTRRFLYVAEWAFTIIFTIEYGLRLFVVYKPLGYAKSFFGIVDLLAILPTYISLFVAGTQSLIIIRALRLLRVFRIFKMANYLSDSKVILRALRSSAPKVTVFLYFIVIVVCIFGAIMYLIEGEINEQFDSIPRSIYWSIVTITTVGYGDISPISPIGQFLSSILMILGYAVIAVPTGIVSKEIITSETDIEESTQCCKYCSYEGHDYDALYCKMCGNLL